MSCNNTRRVGIQDNTVDIKLASSYEDYIVTLASFDSEEQIINRGDGGNLPRKPGHINEDEEDISIGIRVLNKVA